MSTLLSANSRSVKLPSVFHRINFGALSYKEGVNLIADLLKAFVEKEVMMGDDLTAQDVQAEITAQLMKIADGSTALPQGLTFRNEGSGSSALVSNSDRGRDSGRIGSDERPQSDDSGYHNSSNVFTADYSDMPIDMFKPVEPDLVVPMI